MFILLFIFISYAFRFGYPTGGAVVNSSLVFNHDSSLGVIFPLQLVLPHPALGHVWQSMEYSLVYRYGQQFSGLVTNKTLLSLVQNARSIAKIVCNIFVVLKFSFPFCLTSFTYNYWLTYSTKDFNYKSTCVRLKIEHSICCDHFGLFIIQICFQTCPMYGT